MEVVALKDMYKDWKTGEVVEDSARVYKDQIYNVDHVEEESGILWYYLAEITANRRYMAKNFARLKDLLETISIDELIEQTEPKHFQPIYEHA